MSISSIIYFKIKILSLRLKVFSSYITRLTISIANYYTSLSLLQRSAIINRRSIRASSY